MVVGGGGGHSLQRQGGDVSFCVVWVEGKRGSLFPRLMQLALLAHYVVVAIAVTKTVTVQQVAHVEDWSCKLIVCHCGEQTCGVLLDSMHRDLPRNDCAAKHY